RQRPGRALRDPRAPDEAGNGQASPGRISRGAPNHRKVPRSGVARCHRRQRVGHPDREDSPMSMDFRPLQAAVGVNADDIAGRVTWTALFVKLGASVARAEELALAAVVHFPAYEITATKLRLAHFMAQLGHESGGFRYME